MKNGVIIDKRERNQIIIEELKRKGIEVDMKMLDVGDYIVSDRVAIERKTVSDFESSIINGRLFDQLTRLREFYDAPILILEGDKDKFRLRNGVLNGAICATSIEYGVYVITSKGAEDTADIIARIIDHEQNGREREPSVKGGRRSITEKDFQEKIIANLPYIGPKISRDLLAHFGSIRKIAESDIEELTKVKNVGRKRAEKIYKIINSSYNIDKQA